MGFFRRLFGKSSSSPAKVKQKKRWSFAVSSNSNPSQSTKRDGESGRFDDSNLDSNKHAIAVAAATAAVAEAALAAAQAAAEVVRLTSAGGGGRTAAGNQVAGNRRRLMGDLAAVKIQSAFRGYLARRALRALKALVKLQALVRGHIVRKQTSDMLRRMQTLVRLQAEARASRMHLTQSCHSTRKSSRSNHSRGGSISNYRDIKHIDESKLGENWLENWMEESFHDNNNNTPMRYRHEDEKSDKILEVDTWKPHKTSQSVRTFKKPISDFNPIFSSYNSPSKISSENISPKFRVVDNSASSPSSRPGSSGRRGTFTPTKSESSWGYFGHPNYMVNTKSFRAKLRSQSAPRQRLEFEKYSTVNRFAQECYYDADTVSESGFSQQGNSRNRTQQTVRSLSRVRTTNLR